MISEFNKHAKCSKRKQHTQSPWDSMSLKGACRSLLAALSQHVVVREGVVRIAEALASRLQLSKFTIFWKLVFKLKSFKVFSKHIEIQALGVFSKSAAPSGVARRRLSAPGAALFEFRIYLKLLFEVQGSIPSSS